MTMAGPLRRRTEQDHTLIYWLLYDAAQRARIAAPNPH
jgi:hypothetical protein